MANEPLPRDEIPIQGLNPLGIPELSDLATPRTILPSTHLAFTSMSHRGEKGNRRDRGGQGTNPAESGAELSVPTREG